MREGEKGGEFFFPDRTLNIFILFAGCLTTSLPPKRLRCVCVLCVVSCQEMTHLLFLLPLALHLCEFIHCEEYRKGGGGGGGGEEEEVSTLPAFESIFFFPLVTWCTPPDKWIFFIFFFLFGAKCE